MTKWEIIKDYINKNEVFTRKDIDNKIGIDHSTDQYVLLIKHTGFIEKTGRAKYKRLYKIPDYITSNLIHETAYNEDKKNELLLKIIKDIRKEKLNKINNS